MKKRPAITPPAEKQGWAGFCEWLLSPPYFGVPWLVWLYALIACLVCTQGGVFTGHLSGFDDHVRMTQVLNWVNGAGWYDRTIMRVNVPEGFTTIWSRLVDIPIAGVVIFAEQFTDQKAAALVASFVVPFAQLAILFWAARYFARPLIGKANARLIVLFIMFTSVLNFKNFSIAGFHTGEASHHSWYAILNLLLFGSAARMVLGVRGRAPILMMVVAIALSLAVGIESLPLIAGLVALVAMLAWWFNRPCLAARAMQVMLLTTLLSVLLLPLHQPPTRLFIISFVEPSILGPLLIFTAAFFLAIETIILNQLSKYKITGGVLILMTALVLAAGLVWAFPGMLEGAAAGLTPEERIMVFREHMEAWPLWRASENWIDFVGLMAPTLIALAAGIWAIRHAATERKRALYITYFGVTALTGGMAEGFARFYHHAMTTASAWLLWAWQEIKERLPKDNAYSLKALMVFVLLGPFWMLLLPAMDSDAPFLSRVLLYPAKLQTYPDPCNVVEFGHYLDTHYTHDTNLIVPGADSSRLLYYSNLKIDFLNNYPSQNHFIDNQVFFGTQNYDDARRIALAHHIDLVAICRIYAQPTPLKPGEKPMLFEALQMGQYPNWLSPVNTGFIDAYRLFEVNKDFLRDRNE